MSLWVNLEDADGEELYSANITHNLIGMAKEAGIYEPVWEPASYDYKLGADLIAPLRMGIEQMEKEPERFEKYNAGNGWGTVQQFLPWLKKYLAACEEFPEGFLRASR